MDNTTFTFRLVPTERHRSNIRQHRPAPAEVSALYDDAQLYRIVVALAIGDGCVHTKAEFDRYVRNIGTIEAADELIAFRKLRPGCKAWRRGKHMVCECGTAWPFDLENPPYCKGGYE